MAKFPLECRVVSAEWTQWREFGKGGKKLFFVEGDQSQKHRGKTTRARVDDVTWKELWQSTERKDTSTRGVMTEEVDDRGGLTRLAWKHHGDVAVRKMT